MKSFSWVLLLTSWLMLAGCSGNMMGRGPRPSTSGPSTRDLMIQYGCPACHVIPRVPGAVGQVGPSLAGLGQRSYIAGTLPNTPDNIVSWIMHPQHFRPGSAMPEMGVTEQDARRMEIFLESVR